MNKRNKILFIHNSVTWYRIPFFKELNKICDVKFIFSKVIKLKKDYKGIETDYKELEYLNYEITPNYMGISWASMKRSLLEDYDTIVVTVLDSWDQVIEAFICAIIAKVRRKKVAYFWERWDPPKEEMIFRRRIKSKIYRILLRCLSLFIDVYISPGKKSKEYFINNGINKDKIVIAPDASMLEVSEKKLDIRKKLNISNDKKIILYFGRIEEYKGLDVLIKAFSKLEKKCDNVFLLICGDGDYSEYCKELSNTLKVENILFSGIIQPEERYHYYSSCNIFVLPNKYERGAVEIWGLSTNEAMSVGKPVISTIANGGAYDLIKNGFNGYMIDQDNPEELFDSLYKIISNEKLEFQMSKNAKNYIYSNFSYENMAEGFKKAFSLD